MKAEMLRVTYVKSAIGYERRQKETVRSLGLRRLGDRVVVPNNGAIRGMIASIAHLVVAEPVDEAVVTAATSD